MERKEIFGDELIDLLDSVGIRIPELDYGDEAIWPAPFFELARRHARSRRELPRRDRERARAGDRRADGEAHRLERPTTCRATSGPVRRATGAGSDTSTRAGAGPRARPRRARHRPLRHRRDDPGRRAGSGRTIIPTARRTRARAQIAAHVSSRYRAAGRASSWSGAIAGPPLVVSNQPRGKHPDPAPRGGRPAGHSHRRRDRESRDRDHRLGERRPVRAVRLRRPGAPSPAGSRPRRATFSFAVRRSSSRSTPSSTSAGSTPSWSSFRLRRAARSRRSSLFLRRGELGAQLAKPLSETLSPKRPASGRSRARRPRR